MQSSAIEDAAKLLLEARRQRRPLAALPAALRPGNFVQAAAIQRMLVALLGEAVPAYKVAGTTPDTVMWAPVVGSRLVASPGRFAAADMPLLGIEAEIAFRLDEDVTAADRAMSIAEFDARTSIVPAIEIVDTRFESYEGTPVLHRAADFMSNGGLVHGPVWADGGRSDLTRLPIRLHIGGVLACDTVGGHGAKDPRIPALAFIHARDRPERLPAGTLITAGSYTGLLFARPGDTVIAQFAGYGDVSVSFET